jgi:hypothetical protein
MKITIYGWSTSSSAIDRGSRTVRASWILTPPNAGAVYLGAGLHSGDSAQQVEAANPKGRQLGRIPEEAAKRTTNAYCAPISTV